MVDCAAAVCTKKWALSQLHHYPTMENLINYKKLDQEHTSNTGQ